MRRAHPRQHKSWNELLDVVLLEQHFCAFRSGAPAKMNPPRLDPAVTAILFIEFQNDFVSDDLGRDAADITLLGRPGVLHHTIRHASRACDPCNRPMLMY